MDGQHRPRPADQLVETISHWSADQAGYRQQIERIRARLTLYVQAAATARQSGHSAPYTDPALYTG